MKLTDLLVNKAQRQDFNLRLGLGIPAEETLEQIITREAQKEIDKETMWKLIAELEDAYSGYITANRMGNERASDFYNLVQNVLGTHGVVPSYKPVPEAQINLSKQRFTYYISQIGDRAIEMGIFWAQGRAVDVLFRQLFEYEDPSGFFSTPDSEGVENEIWRDVMTESVRSRLIEAGRAVLNRNPGATAAEVWGAMDNEAISIGTQMLPKYVDWLSELKK